jgi:protein tyrosine phosphatase (PTP) superfamily phosphohydrolase (DUF442 family)
MLPGFCGTSRLRQSTDYAFAAVAHSLKAMKRLTGEKKYPAFSICKTGMRVANAMPKLKSKLIPA